MHVINFSLITGTSHAPLTVEVVLVLSVGYIFMVMIYHFNRMLLEYAWIFFVVSKKKKINCHVTLYYWGKMDNITKIRSMPHLGFE